MSVVPVARPAFLPRCNSSCCMPMRPCSYSVMQQAAQDPNVPVL